MFDFILAPIFGLCHDVVANYRDAAAHAPPIDWSGLGGVPWFLGMVGAMILGMVLAGISESRRERATTRQALYREAETQGHLRNVRRDWRGYAEY